MPNPASSITRMRATADADYARAGITSTEQVRKLGADAAYLRLLQNGVRAHFINYSMLALGLFSLIATIGMSADATIGMSADAAIDDMRIETLLPADAATRAWFQDL